MHFALDEVVDAGVVEAAVVVLLAGGKAAMLPFLEASDLVHLVLHAGRVRERSVPLALTHVDVLMARHHRQLFCVSGKLRLMLDLYEPAGHISLDQLDPLLALLVGTALAIDRVGLRLQRLIHTHDRVRLYHVGILREIVRQGRSHPLPMRGLAHIWRQCCLRSVLKPHHLQLYL
jgi:hypothetical protein